MTLKLLKESILIADLHADRIQNAYESLEKFFPLTSEIINTFSYEQLGLLELITSRFAKLQDFLGQKIFPLLLDALKENLSHLSMIDRLHLLEKREFLPSVKLWDEVREARNDVTHEYPEDSQALVNNLNDILVHAKWLFEYWIWLKAQINQRVLSYQNSVL